MATRGCARHPAVMVGVSPRHTSVPRWTPAPAELDAGGVSYVVVGVGTVGAEIAAGWIAEIERRGRPLWSHLESGDRHGEDCTSVLATALRRARVGVRLMVAGPELAVLDCCRAARDAGAIDAEITTQVTDSARKRVHCSHCRALTEAAVAVSETVACEGCGRELFVYHHVSRPHGAYLGFMADAERVPG